MTAPKLIPPNDRGGDNPYPRDVKPADKEVSPKVTAAAAAALVAPLVVRLLADVVGIDVDSETVEGLILAAVAAVSAGAAAWGTRDKRRV